MSECHHNSSQLCNSVLYIYIYNNIRMLDFYSSRLFLVSGLRHNAQMHTQDDAWPDLARPPANGGCDAVGPQE